HHHARQKHHDGLWTASHGARSLGDYLLSARAATEPARQCGRCAGGTSGGFREKSGARKGRGTGEEMSDRSHVIPAPEGEFFEKTRFHGLSLLCGSIGLVGLVLSFIGAFRSPVQFSYSWLFAFI